MIIISLLLLVFLIEGIGKIIPRELIFYLYLILPAVFFIQLIIKKKSVIFPKYPSITFGLFLIFSFISAIFFSVDKQISFELNIFFTSAFLTFIYFYNNKDLAKKHIKLIIFIGSIIFTIVYLLKLNVSPIDGYQLVASYYSHVHNHLGDFLGLGLVFFVYFLINRKESNWFYLLILFFPLFLLSFSRTSYIALLITMLFMMIKSKSTHLFSIKTILVIILVILSMVFFFATVNEANNNTTVGKLNQLLSLKFSLQNKDFTAGRLTYFKQGLKSFADHPLFGVGPGNFGYLSKKYQSEKSQWYEFGTTDTAHSLSLDILFENGGLTFIFYGTFILLLLTNIFRKNKLESYLLLYILINFQTDYTYKIYSMFILFMILTAIVYEEKRNRKNQFTLFMFFSFTVLIFMLSIMMSNLFLLLKQPKLATIFYPFNKEAYKQLIDNKAHQEDCEAAKKDADKLYYLSFGYLPTLNFLSSYYENCGDKKKAVIMLDEASYNNKFISFDIVEKDYLLKKEIYGEKMASNYLKKVLRNYDSLRYDDIFQKRVADFCLKNGEQACQEESFGNFRYFYEPDPKNQEKILKQIPYPESYSINKDTLNERFDYSVNKPIDTFRIVILGDASTFGLLVKTKDNWTEKLEDRLNQNINNPKIKKIEVINLAVHGYDIPYEIERFRRRGLKYKPDLVAWFVSNDNFYQMNEVMFEKLGRIEEKMKKNRELEKEIIDGNYYSAWEKAFEETRKELGEASFFSIIKLQLDSFKQNYSGKLIITGPALNDKPQKLLIEALGKEKVYFNTIENLYEPQYQFPKYGRINEAGHRMISDTVFNFIKENKLIHL